MITDRGIDPERVFWSVDDAEGANFADAHVHALGKTFPMDNIHFGEVTLANVRLVPSLRWQDLASALVVHFPNNWEVLLFVALDDKGHPVAVAMPTAVLAPDLDGVPSEFRVAVSSILNDLFIAGQIDTVEDNLDPVMDIANPPDDDDTPDRDDLASLADDLDGR